MFDGVFIPSVRPDLKDSWHHEQASIDMFEYLLNVNHINLREYGLSAQDETFIKEAILGTPKSERTGRGADKVFMYDIVNNLDSGLDVDKLDYFHRDAKMCGVGIGGDCDIQRFFHHARVCEVEGELRICYPHKEAQSIMDLFALRFKLHSKIYTHKVVKSVEFMLTDVLNLVNPYLSFLDSNGNSVRMSHALHDMAAYSQLNDSIKTHIMLQRDPHFDQAKAILDRIAERKLYRCVGRTLLVDHDCKQRRCPAWCGKTADEIR